MKQKFVETYRKILLEKRKQHQASARQKARAGAVRFEIQDLSDQSHSEHDKTILSQRAASDAKVLAAIDRALARMDAGEYGKCLDCEEDIPEKRLMAVPWAKHCIVCKEKKGQKNARPMHFLGQSTRHMHQKERRKARAR